MQRKTRRKRIRELKRKVAVTMLVVIAVALIVGVVAGVKTIASEMTKRQENMDVVKDEVSVYGCELYGTYEYPFNTMSQDWSADDVEGFYYHEISENSKAAGGTMPVIVQVYLYCVCRNYGVDYEVAFALIERESECRWDAVGDNGNSLGYMQIQERSHKERMERLGCTDLLNPYQNIMVGVDFLAELQEKTGNTMDMLAAYNYGHRGATEHLWNNGIHEYSYNKAIVQRAEELKGEKKSGSKEVD